MGTLLAVVNTVDFGLDPAAAIDAERIDEQSGTSMTIEQGRVLPQAQAELISRGHEFQRREGEYAELPRVQAAGIDPETGERLAATDPRSGESASEGQGRVAQGAHSSLPKTGGAPVACLVGSPLLRWLAACR